MTKKEINDVVIEVLAELGIKVQDGINKDGNEVAMGKANAKEWEAVKAVAKECGANLKFRYNKATDEMNFQLC